MLITYNNYNSSGSIFESRDNNGNLLFITSSEIQLNDSKNFVELDSNFSIYTSSYLDDIMDTEFKELVPPQDLIDAQQNVIPPGMTLISESALLNYEEKILNLTDDLMVSKSLYENELNILRAENSSLEKIVTHVDSAATNILTDLMNKFANQLFSERDPTNNEIWNNLSAIRGILDIPFNNIIEHRIPIKNRETFFSDVTYELSSSIPVEVHRTEAQYSLSFNDNYLLQAFYIDKDKTALLSERQVLMRATRSLMEQIGALQTQLSVVSASSDVIYDTLDWATIEFDFMSKDYGKTNNRYQYIPYNTSKHNIILENESLLQPLKTIINGPFVDLVGGGNKIINKYSVTPGIINIKFNPPLDPNMISEIRWNFTYESGGLLWNTLDKYQTNNIKILMPMKSTLKFIIIFDRMKILKTERDLGSQ